MKKFVILFLVLVSLGIGAVNAQSSEIVKYKSMFTVNFLRYIGWPDASKQGDFVIGVVKNGAMADQLKKITAGKKFGFQNMVIKEFKNVDEITACQVLIVDGIINYSKHAETINTKLNKHSLVITEDRGAILSGSVINFVIVDSKLKFEVSEGNAEKKGLKLSSSLLSMKNAIKT